MKVNRSALLVWTTVILSAALLPAQRSAGGLRGGGVGGSGGNGMNMGPSTGFFFGHSAFGRNRGFGRASLPGYFAYWDYFSDWDDDGYFQDESSYQQPVNTTAPQVIVLTVEPRSSPPLPPEPPKLIEVPQSTEAPVAKRLPPTLFVLTNGERLESRRYLLTAESLQIEVGREERRIPVSVLDLDSTVAVNHERGIQIAFPTDKNSVLVGF